MITESDLYPDARIALTALRDRGLWVGIAGNQTVRAAELLGRLDLRRDHWRSLSLLGTRFAVSTNCQLFGSALTDMVRADINSCPSWLSRAWHSRSRSCGSTSCDQFDCARSGQ